MARMETVTSFIAGLRAYAAANPGTEWDLLPKEAIELLPLIGSGRKMNRVLEGVGDKLRVLKANPALGVAGVAPLGYQGFSWKSLGPRYANL